MEPVTVWWASLDAVRPAHAALLDPVEKGRRAKYLRDADRDRFTLGVALTRITVGARLGVAPAAVPVDRTCPDCDQPHGRPVIAGGPHLSISHSGDRVVLALSPHGPLGVDVEEASGRLNDSFADHVLAEGEQGSGEAELLAYWTRKEALLKATGDGLREPMTKLRVSGPSENPRLLDWSGRSELVGRITMRTLDPGPGYAACLALLDQPADVPVEERPFIPAGPR
ncbi:4'-phosphopantetheinyl transferase family protein [Actinomadura rubteroloni]|uniref:4'-phosphopantetheinyl transferase family protein n=1 Tax=Actinomadura rubteroloni TaxID=1926885 RepID=UPI000CD8A19B|nr:4'-phosphopantetheinyl transferase superfamily protein [Actinomadura rubteroloni]